LIFGIDFGTTYTVVAWMDKGEVHLLNWGNSCLKPTEQDGVYNIKRLICENSDHLFDENQYFSLVFSFFQGIGLRIKEELGFDGLKDCVLTIPVRFDDIARNAIKAAAIKAGFNVLKLLAEPIAAAIAQVKNKQNGYYIVYDLGGGTFDISLLRYESSVFQILKIDGLKDFGGIDIDKIIAEHFEISIEDANKLKLSHNFDLEVWNKINAALKKTYEMFENMVNEYEINSVILAGGSSRLPMIYNYFKDKGFDIICKDYDYAVAIGAAMMPYLSNSDHLLIDVVPFNLGIESLADRMEVIIPKNSPLPSRKSAFFMPSGDGNILINVLQGNSDKVSDCVSLGKFEIPYKEKIEVVFMLDYDSILSLNIEGRIFIVSLNDKHKDKELIEILAKIESINKNSVEAKKLISYLKAAINAEITPEAKKWLFDRIFIEFGNI
jgi:molecular chaperone HscA